MDFPIHTAISGGSAASPAEFPYQVFIKYTDANSRGRAVCGGAIINSVVILTAAHCAFNRAMEDFEIIAGEYDRFTNEGHEQRKRLSGKIIHPNFDPVTLENDIAILVLDSPLTFTRWVKRISYPHSPMKFSGNATVTGWGRTGAHHGRGHLTRNLKKVTIQIVPNHVCRSQHAKAIKPSMICAGGDGPSDSCAGDSGGPLVCKNPVTRKPILCGIVSFGKTCRRGSYAPPGVYTNVSHFGERIDAELRKMFSQGKCSRNSTYCSKG